MTLKSEIMETIESLAQWKDIHAEVIEFSDVSFRKNAQRCYEINAALGHELSKKPDIETLIVGAHYDHNNPSCSNYYVLARDKATGEVALADAVINSDVSGMHQPFVGSLAEARDFMKTHTSLKWHELWDLDHIVVHEPKVSQEKRNSTRNRWGELGKHFVFDTPVLREVPLNMTGEQPFAPTGQTMTLEEMNAFAARHGLNNNYYRLVRPAASESGEPVAKAVQEATMEAPQRERLHHKPREPLAQERLGQGDNGKKGWARFFTRRQAEVSHGSTPSPAK